MSRAELYAIEPDGDVVYAGVDFPNAFLGAFAVWQDLAVRYGLAKDASDAVGVVFGPDAGARLWALADDPRLARRHRIALLLTFDRVLCRKADFPELCASLREYHAELGPEKAHCHLAAWATAVAAALPEDSLGCGFQHTSAAEDQWTVAGAGLDADGDPAYRPYNINVDDDHRWLFDELDARERQAGVRA